MDSNWPWISFPLSTPCGTLWTVNYITYSTLFALLCPLFSEFCIFVLCPFVPSFFLRVHYFGLDGDSIPLLSSTIPLISSKVLSLLPIWPLTLIVTLADCSVIWDLLFPGQPWRIQHSQYHWNTRPRSTFQINSLLLWLQVRSWSKTAFSWRIPPLGSALIHNTWPLCLWSQIRCWPRSMVS